MQTGVFIQFLKDNRMPVFTLEDAVKVMYKPRSYASLFLQRGIKNGKFARAMRGLYYLRERSNEYEIASHVISPSYISMVSALSYFGLTTQIPNKVYVVSTERHKAIDDVMGFEIVFRHVRPGMMFGYHKESDGNVFMADPEKAIVDIFYFHDVNDLDYGVLEKPPRINIRKLTDYAIRSGDSSVIRGVGEMLRATGHRAEAKRLNARKRHGIIAGKGIR